MGKNDIEQQIVETKVRLCLDCGKCTVVCPVSQYNSDFNPRRIIRKSLGRQKIDVKDENIWACFNCHMCLERCNYNVKFPDFVNALRAEAVKQGVKVRSSHGGTLQSLMNLMGLSGLEQRRLEQLPKDIKLTANCDTVFFVGCAPYFDIVFQDIGARTLEGVWGALRLLNRLDIPFDLLPNERCCGRDLLLQGDLKGFQALVQNNLAEFERRGVKKLITACPECYSCLKKEYTRVENGRTLEVANIYELLSPLVKQKALGLKSLSRSVAFQDPCNLGRAFRVFDPPRDLIQAIPGVKLKEMRQNRESALCCGANPWAYCNSVNRQVQGERLSQAKLSGADILVTACPKCQIHLKCAQKNDSSGQTEIEIRDLMALLADALGGDKDGG
jgi:heterodisulfide reductase subunit D